MIKSVFARAKERNQQLVLGYERAAESAIAKAGQASVDVGSVSAATQSRGLPGWGSNQSTNAAEHYRYFRHWVYVCVNAIARRVACQPWQAGQIEGATDNPERGFSSLQHKVPSNIWQRTNTPNQELSVIASHDVLDLLSRPNPIQKQFEFLYLSTCNLLLTGESYWLGGQVSTEDGLQMQLWSLPTSWIYPDHTDGLFSKYFLRPSGSSDAIPVPAECVVRTYYPNPSDLASVYSPLESAISAIRVDDYIQRSQRDMFERGIHPNLLVSIAKNQEGRRPRLTGAQNRQIIRTLREIWSNTVNIGDPAIIDGMVEKIEKLHLTPQEMDWQTSGEIVKHRIMQAYGVNPIVVGEVVRVTQAQAVVAEQNFNTNVANPIINAFSESATDFLGPWYETPKRLVLWIENAHAVDREQRLREYVEGLKADAITQTEFRSEVLGLPPLDVREDTAALMHTQAALYGITALLKGVSEGYLTDEQATYVLMSVFRLSEEEASAIVADPPIAPMRQQLGQELPVFRSKTSLKDKRSKRDRLKSEHVKQYSIAEEDLGQSLARYFCNESRTFCESGWRCGVGAVAGEG
jgi:phage portal protein BeeE